MKSIVLYDSVYGNTETIARSIAKGLGGAERVSVLSVAKARTADLKAIDLLVVGSPTLGGRPSTGMQAFLDALPEGSLEGVRLATFDTRMEMFIARLFGYAADRMAGALKAKGAVQAVPSQGFIVKGRSGPLRKGEEERAAAWGQGMMTKQR
jgi:flavodoxin